MRLVLLFAAAVGCSSAAMSGTLAVLSYAAEQAAQASAER